MYSNYRVHYTENGKGRVGQILAQGDQDVQRAFESKYPEGTLLLARRPIFSL